MSGRAGTRQQHTLVLPPRHGTAESNAHKGRLRVSGGVPKRILVVITPHLVPATKNQADCGPLVEIALLWWRCLLCSKINLGIGAYGRSWTLSDTKRTAVGSPASGSGPRGSCTGEPGYLAWYEIKDKMAKGGRVSG